MLIEVTGRIGLLTGAMCLVLVGSAAAVGREAMTTGTVCGPVRAKTLAADRVARVYEAKRDVYGCARGDRKSYKLGTASNSFAERRAGPIVLAGTDAAYGLTSYGVDTIFAQVVVKRLTDGKVLRQANSISGSTGAEFFETVDGVVVKRDGSVAWIAHASWIGQGSGSVTEVQKSDHTQRTLLDRGGRIGVDSLRLDGSRLTWRVGSATNSASLR
jgi:hypothetical protein